MKTPKPLPQSVSPIRPVKSDRKIISVRASLIGLGGQPCTATFMVSDGGRHHGYDFSSGPISSDFARSLSSKLYTEFDIQLSITPVEQELPTPTGHNT